MLIFKQWNLNFENFILDDSINFDLVNLLCELVSSFASII